MKRKIRKRVYKNLPFGPTSGDEEAPPEHSIIEHYRIFYYGLGKAAVAVQEGDWNKALKSWRLIPPDFFRDIEGYIPPELELKEKYWDLQRAIKEKDPSKFRRILDEIEKSYHEIAMAVFKAVR